MKKIAHHGEGTAYNCCHAISPDSKWLTTGSGKGKASEVTIWEMPTAKKLLTIPVGAGNIQCVAFNRTGDLFAADSGRALHEWALNDAKSAKK